MISLIHPSRGRPDKALSTYKYWIYKSSGTQIEHILSIDFDDLHKDRYISLFTDNSDIVIADNTCVVEATNHAAQQSLGSILVYLSDDFKCPSDWDKLLLQKFDRVTWPMLLKVSDNLNPFDTPVLTIPIMNRKLYERLDYFWNPEYKSMFVDQDLYELCKLNNWLVEAPELIFPHEHFIIGKAEKDETYLRSAANWDQGREVFEKRKSLNFPL